MTNANGSEHTLSVQFTFSATDYDATNTAEYVPESWNVPDDNTWWEENRDGYRSYYDIPELEPGQTITFGGKEYQP